LAQEDNLYQQNLKLFSLQCLVNFMKGRKMSKIYNLNADTKVIAKGDISKRFLIVRTLTLMYLPLTMPSVRSD